MPRNEGTDHNAAQYKTPIDKIIYPRPNTIQCDEEQSPYGPKGLDGEPENE